MAKRSRLLKGRIRTGHFKVIKDPIAGDILIVSQSLAGKLFGKPVAIFPEDIPKGFIKRKRLSNV